MHEFSMCLWVLNLVYFDFDETDIELTAGMIFIFGIVFFDKLDFLSLG